MAFGLVPKILDTVDVIISVGEQLRMVEAEVVEVGNVQHIVAPPTVGIDDTIGDYFAFDNRYQCGRGSVWNDLGVDLPAPLK